jgi:hypothetical protein
MCLPNPAPRTAPLPSGLALGRAYVSVVAFSATADRKTLADHEEFNRGSKFIAAPIGKAASLAW